VRRAGFLPGSQFFAGDALDVDLDHIHEVDQLANLLGMAYNIVEGELEAELLQLPHPRQHLVGGLHGFQDLEDHPVRRQKTDEVALQHDFVDIDEGELLAHHRSMPSWEACEITLAVAAA
jgi:hypothetical protein